MGSQNSMSSRMQSYFPGIFSIKCICHSIHLCCSEACKSLPRRCEDLARNIYNFFSHSSKRQSQFVQFQQFLNLNVHKILHPSQTRWLSLSSVVQRIVEQWDALKLYFTDKWLSEKLISAENIYLQLNDPFTKAYFYFLEWVLPKFTSLNQFFQTENVVLTTLNEKMELVFKEILLCYMKRDYIMKTDLRKINPSDENQFLKASIVYLGVKVLNHVKTDSITKRPDLLNEFYNRCIDFLKISCVQIKKRYDFSNPILPLLNVLNPSVALSISKRDIYPSIYNLVQHLPRMLNIEDNIIIQKIDDQWRNLPLYKLSENIINEIEPDRFWTYIKDLECEQFKDLAVFSISVLCLPHSNASCERIFSKINSVKTKSRNKLITSTVSSTVILSESIKKDNGNCISFKPIKDMLARMTSSNLYPIAADMTQNTSCQDFVIED